MGKPKHAAGYDMPKGLHKREKWPLYVVLPRVIPNIYFFRTRGGLFLRSK
jgi:hypothetical protein